MFHAKWLLTTSVRSFFFSLSVVRRNQDGVIITTNTNPTLTIEEVTNSGQQITKTIISLFPDRLVA